MGLYDKLTMDRESPEFKVSCGDKFRTNSLYAGRGDFTISNEGKLIEHLFRYEPSTESEPFLGKRIELGTRIIEYHGDILLCRDGTNSASEEPVARFTHGTLECLIPISEYPEANRVLLVEQGAR
jgi:hypothetical protein